MRTTTSFNKVKSSHRIFKRLIIPEKLLTLLNSGQVLFVFGSVWTWASFPIGPHRTIVKDLKTENVLVDKKIKVILEIDKEIKSNEEKNILDHIGHTLLYLLHPKASNECKDAQNFIKTNNIKLSLK
jgi:hypothetical protein